MVEVKIPSYRRPLCAPEDREQIPGLADSASKTAHALKHQQIIALYKYYCVGENMLSRKHFVVKGGLIFIEKCP